VLQLDRRSLPWEELRESILAAGAEGPNGMRAHELLAHWDGRVTEDSAAATVFELLLAELCDRVARRKAPKAHEWALGKGLNPIFPFTFLAYRRVGHLVKLILEDAPGWWPEGWTKEISSSLEAVASRLLAERGPCTEKTWAWGAVRPLTLLHPAGESNKLLGKIFNLGPIPFGGDTNTVAQASSIPTSPTGNPPLIPAMRMVIDVGEWDNSKWVLASGQSGNPCSHHYSDHFELWRQGRLAPMLWSQDAVAKATRSTLELFPVEHGGER
jgi:penicillin amidase